MADKDLTEREAFAAAFPNSELLIRLYHTFCTFQREITVDELDIMSGERNYVSLYSTMNSLFKE